MLGKCVLIPGGALLRQRELDRQTMYLAYHDFDLTLIMPLEHHSPPGPDSKVSDFGSPFSPGSQTHSSVGDCLAAGMLSHVIQGSVLLKRHAMIGHSSVFGHQGLTFPTISYSSPFAPLQYWPSRFAFLVCIRSFPPAFQVPRIYHHIRLQQADEFPHYYPKIDYEAQHNADFDGVGRRHCCCESPSAGSTPMLTVMLTRSRPVCLLAMRSAA